MQHFHLTEEQSTDYINTLQSLVDMYSDYNKESSDIVTRWFVKYIQKRRHWFKSNRSTLNSFLDYISIGSPIYHVDSTNEVTALGGCHYGIYRTRLSKVLDEKSNEEFLNICSEVNIVERCVHLPEHVFKECQKKLDLLSKYSNVPFTLSEDWIAYKDTVEFYIREYNATLSLYKMKRGKV